MKYKTGILQIDIIIDKKVREACKAKFGKHFFRDMARGLTVKGFRKKVISAKFKAFTDKEIGKVYSGYMPEKYPIGSLKPVEYKEGRWQGDYFLINKTSLSWVHEYKRKYHSDIILACRSVGGGKVAVFRMTDYKVPKVRSSPVRAK